MRPIPSYSISIKQKPCPRGSVQQVVWESAHHSRWGRRCSVRAPPHTTLFVWFTATGATTAVPAAGREDDDGGPIAVDVCLNRHPADCDNLAVPVHEFFSMRDGAGAVAGVEDAACGCSSTRRSVAFRTIPSGGAVVPRRTRTPPASSSPGRAGRPRCSARRPA